MDLYGSSLGSSMSEADGPPSQVPSGLASTPRGGDAVRQEITASSRTPLIQFWKIRITGSLVPGDTWEARDTAVQRCFIDSDWITETGIQREKGKRNGIEHYQGVFKLVDRKRFATVANLLKPHFPDVKWDNVEGYLNKCDSAAADKYVMKEDTRQAGPWFKGACFEEIAKETVYKIEIELRPWQQKVCYLIESGADDRHIWWIWEPCGGAGKTTFQKYIFQNYQGVTISGGKASDMKNGIIRYREQTGKLPGIILINLPMTFNLDYFCPHGVEEVKDMFFFSGKYGEKGSNPIVCGKPPHIFIFANRPPECTANMARDRWKIARIPDGPGKQASEDDMKIDWT